MAEPDAPGVRVCASIAAPDLETLGRRLRDAGDADLVEVRWDALEDGAGHDAIAGIVASAPVPVLFTCRPAWQGGRFSGSERERLGLLAEARAAGARWIDVEMDAEGAQGLLAQAPDRTLLSHHWDAPRPADVRERVERIVASAPAIGKLVAPAVRPDDATPLLAAAATLRTAGVVPACFTMGEAGRASRLLSIARAGGIVYADGGGPPTAPGQWTRAVLRDDLGVGRWLPGCRTFGLVGHPLEHSLSPAVFNAAFREAA